MKINILAVKAGDNIKLKGKAKIIKISYTSPKMGIWKYIGGKIIMSRYDDSLYDVHANNIKIIKSKIVEVM